MAEYMEEFKFPDEKSGNEVDIEIELDSSGETDIEIEIEDDTPEEDRGRKPLAREVEDPSDDEVEQYSDKVQKRIKELAHARHDERRAKEAAVREREEAVRAAQHLADENKKLRGYVTYGEESFATVLKSKAEADLAMARKQYKEAAESYDTDAMLEAQEALADAKMRLDKAQNFKPTPLQEAETPVYSQSEPESVVRPDEKTLRWQAKNQWFGQNGYEELTAMALALHQRLTTENGQEYARTDEYFERIDARLHSKFPEVFGSSKSERETSSKRPAATVVAPAARSTSTKKLKLTKSQESIASKLGLTNQQYAKEVLKLGGL
jgi:hypothetical protein